MAKHGLLDDIMGDLEAMGESMKRRKCMTKEEKLKNSNPYSASNNYEREELVYRDDDFDVAPVSIMDTSLTYNIPEPTAAYQVVKKMAKEQEHILPFQTYWLQSSRYPSLDLNLPTHMLAVFMIELYRRKPSIVKLMRPFQDMVSFYLNFSSSTRN